MLNLMYQLHLLMKLASARVSGALALTASLMLSGMAWAQAAAPQPQLQRTASPLIGYGLIFLMLAIVVSISLIPSKRGHQD